MRNFEEAIDKACKKGEIPGAVLVAADRTGRFRYAKAFGKRSVREGADQSPLKLDAVMWIASCTKLITTIAAMQCVERGLLTLDGPVYDVLPELRHQPVITGFREDGEPVTAPHRRALTLRHLLTHSSGIAYDETHPKLLAWLEHQNRKPSKAGRIDERYLHPLVFEPGTSWCYGAGVDWAGKMVERINGRITLQEYFEKNIFAPLGVKDVVFSPHLKDRPEMVARQADMSKRDQDNPDKVKRSNAWLQFQNNNDCFGGLGLFASAPEYLKVLRGLLTTDEDGKLLKRETVEKMFQPSLSDAAKQRLIDVMQLEEVNNGMGGLPQEVAKSHAIGGIMTLQDFPNGQRRANTMSWGGLPNLTWFVDRKGGLCGLFAAQLLPPGDAQLTKLERMFETGMYEMYQSEKSKL